MRKIKFSRQRLRKSMLPAIIVLQFLLIGFLGYYAYHTRQMANDASTDRFRQLVLLSIDALLKDTNVDAQTGKVYIYESKLVFPLAPDNSYDMLYRVNPAYQDTKYDQSVKAELHLVNRFAYSAAKSKVLAVQSLSQVMGAIPKLQACGNGYLIVFSPIAQYQTEWKPVFNKKLKDARTAYVYQQDGCTGNNKHMVPYLKQVDSY